MPQRIRPYTANVEDYEVVTGDASQWEAVPDAPPQPTTGENIRNTLEWLGKVMGGAFFGPAGVEAVKNPGATLAGAALGNVPRAIAAIPTRAKAGLKFQEVMKAVGDKTVDTTEPRAAVIHMRRLAQRGTKMPSGAGQFEKRVAPTQKGPRGASQWTRITEGPPMKYEEARDFYSNLRRLSATEAKSMNPVMRRELNGLLASLDKAIAKATASGGKEAVYRRAMREYAVASRLSEFSKAAAKYGAGMVGLGTAYKLLSD